MRSLSIRCKPFFAAMFFLFSILHTDPTDTSNEPQPPPYWAANYKAPRLEYGTVLEIINEGHMVFEIRPPENDLKAGGYATSIWRLNGAHYIIHAGGWADQHIYGIGPIEWK